MAKVVIEGTNPNSGLVKRQGSGLRCLCGELLRLTGNRDYCHTAGTWEGARTDFSRFRGERKCKNGHFMWTQEQRPLPDPDHDEPLVGEYTLRQARSRDRRGLDERNRT